MTYSVDLRRRAMDMVNKDGYSPKGERLYDEQSGRRFARTSIIAGLRQGVPVAPMTFKGHCNTSVVYNWVVEELIPRLKPGDVVPLQCGALLQCGETGGIV